jgi:septum site-determining protein MinC
MSLDFKSATLYAVRVVLQNADTTLLLDALEQRMRDAGSFFENEPVVIDASQAEGSVDWPALLDALRRHNLPPIGVVADGDNLQAAIAAGLTPVDLSSAPARAPAPERAPAAEPESAAAAVPAPEATPAPAAPQPAPPAMLVHGPLRSGQRVYARNTDLIVVGLVSRGAEVIADGNVHVYGPLRGKAMAGARGDAAARIFTTELDAELLSVAGIYRVLEDKPDHTLHNKPAQVSLEGETLRIEALGS